MRTRDEVLREFDVHGDLPRYVQERMADRIRELESQQAASEPVAWKETLIKLRLCAGSHVPSARLLGNITAEEILVLCDHFIAHPSAAGVRTLVERIKRDLARYNSDDELQRIVDTAASEGASV